MRSPTDLTVTPDLETIRAKRLQFFSQNQSIQDVAMAPKSAAPTSVGLSKDAVSLCNGPVSLEPLQGEAELDPLLLQNSGVPEHQKLRHVLSWAQNFIRTGPTGPPATGQSQGPPINTDHVTHTECSHVTLADSRDIPTRQILPSPQIYLSQSGPVSQPSPLPRPLTEPYFEPQIDPLFQAFPNSHSVSLPGLHSQHGMSVYETYLMCVARLSCRQMQDQEETLTNTPSVCTTPEPTANTPAHHSTTELAAKAAHGLVATELTKNFYGDDTTTEITANMTVENETVMVNPNSPANHTTAELAANTSADHSITETTPDTSDDRLIAELLVPNREEDMDKVQTRCHSGSDEEKRQSNDERKPAGSRPRQAISSGTSRRRRFWEKSSILWSSFPEGTLLPRMKRSNWPAATSCSVADSSPQDSSSGPDFCPLHDSICSETLQHHVPGGTVRSCWFSLPDELWMDILKLMSHRDLCRVAQTCQRLCRLANDRTLWQVVIIENSRNLNADWLSSIGRRGPRSLALYRCTDERVTPRGLEKLFAGSGRSLRELRIGGCSGPGLHGDKLLLPCSRYCTHLTNVDVSWTGATDISISALATATSSLETLVVNGCNITDRVFKIIVRRHGGSLCRLEVFGCRGLSAPCVSAVATGCPNLRVLNLGKLPKMTEACLTFITSHLKHLTSLDLTGLAVVQDQTVHQVSCQCPELQNLTLRCCPAITDRSLIEIGTYSTSIRYLDVSGCSAVTDLGIQAISMACRHLQYLDLSSTKTSSKGVRHLASYGSRHLHTLKISFCYICQDTLRKLCRYHKGLRLLHLYGACDFHNVLELRLLNPNLEAKCDLTCVTPPGQLCLSHT
ncbi:hypothetical protein GJAV_G00026620 [Gymnothorax javanicus]|nr:hypothetical protein GJAV_G00026620 [Gymnothorax javanicus]